MQVIETEMARATVVAEPMAAFVGGDGERTELTATALTAKESENVVEATMLAKAAASAPLAKVAYADTNRAPVNAEELPSIGSFVKFDKVRSGGCRGPNMPMLETARRLVDAQETCSLTTKTIPASDERAEVLCSETVIRIGSDECIVVD